MPVDPRIFDPDLARRLNDPNQRQAKREKSMAMDDPDDMAELAALGRRSARRVARR